MSTRERLIKRFRSFAYRHSYVDSFVDASIATQIKVLREGKGWSQEDLASAAKMKQSQISRLESVENSSWQVRTLKRIAKALDVALAVRFESFGNVLSDIDEFGREALQRPSFEKDPAFKPQTPLLDAPKIAASATVSIGNVIEASDRFALNDRSIGEAA
jgi:transcriptional regulator with XRE-family HTH domain